jgi:uracil-DNA glycosylase
MRYPNNNWKDTFDSIDHSFLKSLEEKYLNKNVLPEKEDLFKSFELCDIDDVRVVILGQDPYHTKGVADGLAFSSKKENHIPPSLKNIFKELNSDLGIIKENGNLISWANQGILLMNTILTVEEGKPLSHSDMGWEILTDNVLSKLNKKENSIIFVLWGEKARSKKKLLDNPTHFIIESSHPSFFSYKKGFEGSKPFSKINIILDKLNHRKIDW